MGKRSQLQLLVVLLFFAIFGNAQEPMLRALGNIETGRAFLQALYPKLKGKHFVIKSEAVVPFDGPASKLTEFRLRVEDSPAVVAQHCCVGGKFGGELSAPILAPPSEPRPDSTSPKHTPVAEPNSSPTEKARNSHVGPKQYLTSGFVFDESGHLTAFTAQGLDVGSPEGLKRFLNVALPQMTDKEINTTLMRSGAKYTPDEKDRFLSDVPIKTLEPFLGRLDIVSVRHREFDRYRNSLLAWPYWTVTAVATRGDGTQSQYEMTFESFAGDLVSLRMIPLTDKKNRQ
jgi:hypothetical protein